MSQDCEKNHLPQEKSFVFALAGNPNSGKTTLFNALTGGQQYVGNWPGVTVEKKEGHLKDHPSVLIQDLPGIYSLSPYSQEEVVARRYLVEEVPDLIINIVDGSNLERNLYLTTQLAELGIPMVVAVNMWDVVERRGDVLNLTQLASALACPVVAISALKESGIKNLVDRALTRAQEPTEQAKIVDFPQPLHEATAKISDWLATTEALANMPKTRLNWYALKLLAQDSIIEEQVQLPEDAERSLSGLRAELEDQLDDDIESSLAQVRYEAIAHILQQSYHKKRQGLSLSDRIDRIVTNRWLALPIFIGVMFLMYYLAISGGAHFNDMIEGDLFGDRIQPGVQAWLVNLGASETVQSLVVDGIIAGIGAPLSFLPQMALVFLFMALLEDCGYMARVAFIMDRLFRRFGLSGKSFISFLVSSGCAVPGIMAARTIEQERDRRMTAISTGAMPCSAKLPLIALVAGYVSGAWWIAPLIYFSAILVVIIYCLIMKKLSLFSGEAAPFVMELPAYHLPVPSNVLLKVWVRVKAFLKKAGTIIFAMSVLMWFLVNFGITADGFGMVEQADHSLLAAIGGLIAWLFIPLGFGNWQAIAATLAGFAAKESVVSTMGILAGLGEIEEFVPGMEANFSQFFPTHIAAISFLFFNMFNSPCLAAVSTLYRELDSKKYFAFALIYQNAIAYALSLMVYQFCGLITGDVHFTWATLFAAAVFASMLYLLLKPVPQNKEGR